MSSSAADLTRIHQLLTALKEVREDLARGPRLIKIREQKIAQLREEITRDEAELKQTRLLAEQKNLSLKTKEGHLNELQIKLNQATSNREYDILKGQIAADIAAKAVLEDEIIESLERIDLTQRKIFDCKARIAEAEGAIQEFARQFELEAQGLKTREGELLAQLTEAETVIPAKHLDTYRRVVAAYGPDALAEASGGTCNQCFVTLTLQNQVLLNKGEIVFCTCGRLLFLPTS